MRRHGGWRQADDLRAFEDLHDVVLVGHRMSGVVVPRVAEAFPGRIRKVAWMAAVVLNDGETITEAVPAPSPAVQRSFAQRSEPGRALHSGRRERPHGYQNGEVIITRSRDCQLFQD